MKITPKNKNLVAKNYANYVLSCDKIKNHKKVSLFSLQRILQLNGKTTLLNGSILTFCLKYGEKRIKVVHIPKNAIYTHYFQVTLSSAPHIHLEISADNTKELMYKINHVYELLKPSHHA